MADRFGGCFDSGMAGLQNTRRRFYQPARLTSIWETGAGFARCKSWLCTVFVQKSR
jgi:hypothetical protein